MKKEYQCPTAQKVSFAYDKVTAASDCYWYGTITHGGRGCGESSPQYSLKMRSMECHPDGGYMVNSNS